jgi:hypothetical protein
MQPSEKLFLQTVGRFVAERLRPLHARILDLENQVRELQSEVRELEAGGIKYCGVWQKACSYKRGTCITHAGSMWVAVTDVQPMQAPGADQAWQLAVKRGRDADTGAAV